MIYCDHNATTPLRPQVLEAMLPFLRDDFGNASSVHQLGSRARCAIEEARRHVARLIGAQPSEIVFTSGGTEANNLAILGGVPGCAARLLQIAATDHASVRAAAAQLRARGCVVEELRVDAQGFLESLQVIAEDAFVSVAWANNEVGTIQQVEAIAAACRRRGARFHVDAVQAGGKIPVNVDNVDLLSLSAHKIGGPKGVGALFVRKGVEVEPRLFGGEQERGRRPGTENVAGIVGFGEACRLALAESASFSESCTALREGLWASLSSSIDGVQRNSPAQACLPNTLHVSFEGIRGEALVAALDLMGVAVSSGSACAAGAGEPSHVLLAMGRTTDAARNGVRFSFGRTNDGTDVNAIADVTAAAVARIRSSRVAEACHA